MSFPFQRFVSRLVLLSFLFQTLWPSWALAADGGVEVLRSSSPLGFRFGSMGRPESPQLSLEVFSDDEDDAVSSSPRSLFQKTFQPSDIMATVAPLLATMVIFGQLQVKAEGIEWFAQGLWMTITWQGELLVRGDERAPAVTHPIILQNPHKVCLGEGIALSHLKVISPLVVNLGQDSRIGLLEAIGLHSSSTGAERGAQEENKPSVFQNAPGASLTVKQAVLQGIQWQNQGGLTLTAGGELAAGGSPVENTGTWHFEEGAKLTHALSVLNAGSMAGTGNWHLDDVGLVVNSGTLGKGTDTLHPQGQLSS